MTLGIVINSIISRTISWGRGGRMKGGGDTGNQLPIQGAVFSISQAVA